MKTGRKIAKAEAPPAAPASTINPWPYAAIAATFAAVLFVYSPALNGRFVFDDMHLPFLDPNALSRPFSSWLGARPLLMATYWANLHLFGAQPLSFHVANVLFHACAGILLFFAVRKILQLARVEPARLNLLAGFGAAVFLLHPIQTEGVSYVAQRGENLGAVFYFAAFCVFLYRRAPMTWPRTFAVLGLFLAAVVTKEHTVTLPALLLLTDYFWNPGFSFSGAKKNWRLYSLIGLGLAAAVLVLWRLIGGDTTTIGFKLPEFTPAQYLFTQFRVFFAYLGLFLYPLPQTIEYDFSVSHTLAEHGAAIALAGILALASAAFYFRRRYPLASYGFLVFGLLLLPTSSLVPIKDTMVDRRMYLPLIGLIFIALEFVRRWKVSRAALSLTLACVCLLLAAVTYNRNGKWASPQALWADAADKAPDKVRAQFGYAASLFLAGRCHDSIPHYEKALSLSVPQPDYQVLMNLGMAYDCDHQDGRATQLLQRSIEAKPTAEAFSSLAFVQAKSGQLDEALKSLAAAQAANPAYAMTYLYRGGVFRVIGRVRDAEAQYRKALELDPSNAAAAAALHALGS